MSTRSEVCCYFLAKDSDKFKAQFKNYIMQVLERENKDELYMLSNFLKIEQIQETTEIGFCLEFASISFSYIEEHLNRFLIFLHSIKKEVEIKYEAIENYSESEVYCNYHRTSFSNNENEVDDNDYNYDEKLLYIEQHIAGIPTVDSRNINLLDWIKM